MDTTQNEWVILAHKHRNSGGRNDGPPFWGPNSGGYRMTLTEAGLYSEQEARAIVAGTQKGDHEAFHFADPKLRAVLVQWGQLRRVEFDQFHQLRATETTHKHLAESFAYAMRQAGAYRIGYHPLSEGYTHDEVHRMADWASEASYFLSCLNRLQLSAEVPSSWVLVTERLPVDEIHSNSAFETVLYLVARPAVPYVSAVALGYLFEGNWYIVREGEEDDLLDNSVYAWQPLPAGPATKAGKEPQGE